MANGQKTKNSIIWPNKPENGNYGQYYYDGTSEFFEYIYPGIGDTDLSSDDLYSLVYQENEPNSIDEDTNRQFYNQKFWQYYGMGIRIDSFYVNNRRNDDNEKNQLGIYLLDDNADTENDLLDIQNGNDIIGYLGGSGDPPTPQGGDSYGDEEPFTDDETIAATRMVYHTWGFPNAEDSLDGDYGAWNLDLHLKNLPYDMDQGEPFTASGNWHGKFSADNEINTSMIDFSEESNKNSSASENYILIFRFGCRADEGFGLGYENYDNLNRSYQMFKIPKSYFKDLILYNDVQEIKLVWDQGTNQGDTPGYYDSNGDSVGPSLPKISMPPTFQDNHGSGTEGDAWYDFRDDKQNAGWELDGLTITLTAPSSEGYDFKDDINDWDMSNVGAERYPAADGDLTTDIGWPIWIPNEGSFEESEMVSNFYYGFNPISAVDYASMEQYKYSESLPDENFRNFTQDCIDDFRPLSWIYTIGRDDMERSLQRYYFPNSQAYEESSAPNVIYLSFDIAKSVTDFSPEILEGEKWNGSINTDNTCEKDIGYKFAVVRWGDPRTEEEDMLSDDWDPNIINEIKDMDINSYNNLNNQGLYQWQDVRLNEDGSPYGELFHQYNEPGLYLIKALVFSYVKHPTEEKLIQPIRWKQVDIKINLNTSDPFLEDFSELGGPDFVTLPWPYYSRTPIISGISERSNYFKSLKITANANKFDDDEILEFNLVNRASKNDELGKFVGKNNLEQVRVFSSGKYDMSYLLGIEENNIIVDKLYSYSNSMYWDGINNKFPMESSVSSIFINDEIDLNLKSNCVLELNLGLTESGAIIDTSGNGNKGMMIGDYSIKKQNKNVPLSRETSMDLPEKNNEDSAL